MIEQGKDRSPGSGRALSLAYTMIGAIGALTLGGAWLDKKLGGGFVFMLTGMAIAIVYIGYELWKLNRLVYGKPDTEHDDDTAKHSDS